MVYSMMAAWTKRAASVVLAAALFLAFPAVGQAPAAASGASPASTERADRLAALPLFRGTGVREDGSLIYSLDQQPTRLQGLIMLLRLLGQEEAALAYEGESPFTDVSGVGAAYTGYAFAQGLTNGTTADTFTPSAILSARAYAAFLLRALGYSETEGDYEWGGQFPFMARLGILTETAAARLDEADLNRGDLVDLSYSALTCRLKGDDRTLAEKLCGEGVFTEEEGRAAAVLGEDALWVLPYYTPYDNSESVSYSRRTVSTSHGDVAASVIRVNPSNPAVTVKAAMVDNTLNHTASFESIVSASGAYAAINGNFFSSYSAFKAPIGHVMTNGNFLYGNSGLTSLGITSTGELRLGRPAVFFRLTAQNAERNDVWAVYESNTADQDSSASVLYTPAYGKSFTVQRDSWALIVRENVIRDYYYVTEGASITIPEDGFVVWMGTGYASTEYFRIPQEGAAVTLTPYLRETDEEGFTLEGVVSMISGAPRLVTDGKIVTTLEPGFQESRFTTASSPRTAAGITSGGRLLLVCVPGGCTIPQLREAMLALGCVDAFNLDGGASCGMYCNGTYIARPGRELTVTLQVFVDGS